MPNRKPRGKKNNRQAQQYMSFVRESTFSPEETIEHNSQMLQGSNYIDEENSKSRKESANYQKKPIKYVVLDWIKNNVALSITIPLVLTVAGYIAVTTIDNKIQINTLDYRATKIESRIEKIENNTAEKEDLISEMEKIKLEISQSESSDIKDLQWRLKIIEDKLDKLEDS